MSRDAVWVQMNPLKQPASPTGLKIFYRVCFINCEILYLRYTFRDTP